MKKNILIFAFSLFSVLISSCFKDNGNYDYENLDNGEISGILDSYYVLSGNSIQIEPDIAWEVDSEITYEWTYYQTSGSSVESSSVNIPVVISTDKSLDWAVNLPSGDYVLRLAISTDDENYRLLDYTTNITVASNYSAGFYVFKEVEESMCDMDVLRPDGGFSSDIYYNVYGRYLAGNPVSFSALSGVSTLSEDTGEKMTINLVMPITDSEFCLLNSDDLSIYRDDFSDMFYTSPEGDEKPVCFFPTSYAFICVTDIGNVYNTKSYYLNSCSNLYGLPSWMPGDYEVTYKCAPVIGSISNSSMGFDLKEKRFLFMSSTSSSSVTAFSSRTVTGNASLEDIDGTPIYAGSYTTGSSSITPQYTSQFLFDNEDGTMKLYDVINYYFGGTYAEVYNLSSDYMINQANVFGCSYKDEKGLYYAVGSDAYFLRIATNSLTISETKLTLSGIDSSSEITYICSMYRNFSDSNDFYYLAVATYNSANNSYKVYFYETVAGQPVGEAVKTMEGVGKVSRVQYVATDQGYLNSANSYAKYSYGIF